MERNTTLNKKGKAEWKYSCCGMCLHGCGIKVKVIDGVAVKIEGDEGNVDNLGKLCPKGNAGLMRLYDPYRLKSPLKRTNPEKGIGVDPKWVEITWEEALDIIVSKLKKIRGEDPRKLAASIVDFQRGPFWGWHAIFGSPTYFSCAGTSCGPGYHPINGIVDGTFAAINDYEYCNYWIQIGAGDGFTSHLHVSGSAKRMADARMRGMKLVVLEPWLSTGATKADEWIPCIPGTDRAFVLGMMHVLVHELDKYDAEFLKIQTNAPYLVDDDEKYVREQSTGKALVWDKEDMKAKAYNDPTVKCYALEGEYSVNERKCRPAFQIFKNIIKEYTPERVSEITSVPAETIRRISKEYVEAARIGSDIVIDGKKYPYRPAAVNYYRGAQHLNNWLDNATYVLINMLIGNYDVPGGRLGVPLDTTWLSRGHQIKEGEDGLVKPFPHPLGPVPPFKYPPDSLQLIEFFPIGFNAGQLCADSMLNPEKYGIDFKPEVLMLWHSNPLWHMPGTDKFIEVFKRFDFIFAIDIVINESVEWADVILPDHTYLESYTLNLQEPPVTTGYCFRQPVVEPLYNTKDALDILTELSYRLGFLDKWNEYINYVLGIVNKPEYMLEPDRKYSSKEIVDRWAKTEYGDDCGIEWFEKHGSGGKVRKRTKEETYQVYGNLRIPFCFEFVKRTGEELKKQMEKASIDWWDYSDYSLFPSWKPNPIHFKDEEYDLYAINFKTILHTFADTVVIPTLNEVAEKNIPDAGVLINTKTATKKGVKNDDVILIKSRFGEIKGIAKLTEGIHPDVIGISNSVSRWINHPIINKKKVKGTHLNKLLDASLDYTCKVSGGYEQTARVKILKI